MCCPLSRSSDSLNGTLRARPPPCAAISNSETSWPASVAWTAAAKPAHPAPITATRRPVGLTSLPAPLGARGDPQLAQRGQRSALVQHLKAVLLDFAQQRAVDVGHHQPR